MQEKNKTVVILGSGKAQQPFILKAKELGYTTVVFDIKAQCASSVADTFYEVSIYEADKIIETLKSLDLNIKAIVARVTSIKGLSTAYKLSKEFSVRFASKELLNFGTNKESLFRLCLQNSINIPKTYFIKTYEDMKSANLLLNKNYIIKPCMTISGKTNIIKFDLQDDLESLYSLTRSSSENKEVIIQEYIDGIDFNVLVEFKNNSFKQIASWDEIIGIGNNKHIKGLGLATPSCIITKRIILQQLNKILEKFAALLPNEEYIIAFSFRKDKSDKIYLIEIHADLIGDSIAEQLLPTSCENFDFFDLVVKFLLEEEHKTMYEFEKTILLYEENILLKNPTTKEKSFLLKKAKETHNLLELSYLDYLEGEK